MSAQANVAKVAIAGAALLIATPAFAGDAGAGEKIFNANCAACHAGGQNSVVPDHTLEKAAIEKVSFPFSVFIFIVFLRLFFLLFASRLITT